MSRNSVEKEREREKDLKMKIRTDLQINILKYSRTKSQKVVLKGSKWVRG